MAKLADVQSAMSGGNNATLNETLDLPQSSFSPVLTEAEIPEQTNVIFRLVRKKQRRLYIDGIGEGIHPKTKKRERIYLIRGEASIWQSELGDLIKDIDKPNSYINKNRDGLLFEDGICIIPSDQEKRLEFARANIKNVGKNRNRADKYAYYEYDPQEEQRYRLEKQMNRINLVAKISSMEEDKMKKLAAFVGVSFVDELGMPKGIDGVRSELMVRADTSPDEVSRYIDSKEVEVSWMVRRAILDAKIDLTAQSGNALWAGGKGFIGKIPVGRKAHEYLTELALTNSDDGRRFKEQLEQIVT